MTPFVDPHMQAILTRLSAVPPVDYRSMPIADARRLSDQNSIVWVHAPFALEEVRDVVIPTDAGFMRGRLHRPRPGVTPIILYAHGGGWTFGSIDTHDATMRHLARESGYAVLGVDYRLAPEHPFPAPLEDVLAALRFVESGALGDAIDHSEIVLAGDSAGATLALAALLALRQSGAAMPRGALLFYGCYAPVFDTSSHQRYGDGTYLLSTASMRWYWGNLLGGEARPAFVAPLDADLGGLPPLYLALAALDPLADDTLTLSARLTAAGVRHRLDVWPGVVHGFLRMTKELPTARQALRAAGTYLQHAND